MNRLVAVIGGSALRSKVHWMSVWFGFMRFLQCSPIGRHDCPLVDMIAQIWGHKFEVDWIDAAYTSDGRWSDAWSCFILLESVFSTRKYFVADGQWLPIEQLHTHLDVSPAPNLDEPADNVSFLKFEDESSKLDAINANVSIKRISNKISFVSISPVFSLYCL